MAVNAAPSGEAPPGRLAGRWVPWLVIGLWVALAVVMGPLSGKLSSVTTDSAADTLPAGAESTKVAVLEDSLPGGDDNTFVFVYHRDGGLTDADRATVERHYNTFAKRYPPKVTTAPGGDEGEGPPTMPSTDGKASSARCVTPRRTAPPAWNST
jgi:putative drug exporter of the RND superfamily